VRSFLADTADWTTIGHPPSQDPWLSQYGGIFFGEQNSQAQWISDFSQVSFGTVPLTNGGASGTVFYSEFIKGTGTFTAKSASLGSLTCGPFTQPLGYYATLRCKSAPVISAVGPLVSNAAGRVVQSGATIIISGSGLGQQCDTCVVFAYPGPTKLQVSTWNDQAISAILPASYSGFVQVQVQAAAGSDSINIMAASPNAIAVSSVTNSASGAPGAIAPGEIVAIKGTGLGPATGVSFSVNPSTGLVDSTLGGTRVFFGPYAAPITYASATQINAIVPYEIAGQSEVTMQVSFAGNLSAGTPVQVASAAPGAFTFNATGTGQAIAANADGTFNGPSKPAPKGSYVTIYFTGGGQTIPAGTTGSVTGLVLKWLAENIAVTVGNQPAMVQFDGAAPTFVDGVNQLNIQLAANTPSGPAQALVITVGGLSSPATATIAVQ
jgi:uncharacterized protein (TIGR03437 family)